MYWYYSSGSCRVQITNKGNCTLKTQTAKRQVEYKFTQICYVRSTWSLPCLIGRFGLIWTKQYWKICLGFNYTETLTSFKTDEHGDFANSLNKNATGSHLIQPEKSLHRVQTVAFKEIKKKSDLYRKESKEYFISKLNAVHLGINRKY